MFKVGTISSISPNCSLPSASPSPPLSLAHPLSLGVRGFCIYTHACLLSRSLLTHPSRPLTMSCFCLVQVKSQLEALFYTQFDAELSTFPLADKFGLGTVSS